MPAATRSKSNGGSPRPCCGCCTSRASANDCATRRPRRSAVARGPSSAGITSEIVSLYRARGVRRIGKGGGVGNEDITVHVVPRARLRSFLREKNEQGVLTDLKVALYFLTQST